MAEVNLTDMTPRQSHPIERAYYNIHYAVASLAKSSKGHEAHVNHDLALRDLNTLEARVAEMKTLVLEAKAKADAEKAIVRAAQEAEAAEKAAAQAAIDKAAKAEAARVARNAARRKKPVQPDLPPLSEAARIDQQIGAAMRAVANEDEDISVVTPLIRQRVAASLPKTLIARLLNRAA